MYNNKKKFTEECFLVLNILSILSFLTFKIILLYLSYIECSFEIIFLLRVSLIENSYKLGTYIFILLISYNLLIILYVLYCVNIIY